MSLQDSSAVDLSLETVFGEFIAGLVRAVPNLLSGLLFLILAYLGTKIILTIVERGLDRAYPEEQDLVVNLSVVIVALFLWFGVALTLLKIVGMGEIAASLGTVTGFIGLGVAFALKEMIADTGAGVYLLRNPDFNIGDQVTTASVTGVVTQIGLRKTRIRDDEVDLIVVSNRDIEKNWTRLERTPDERESMSTSADEK